MTRVRGESHVGEGGTHLAVEKDSVQTSECGFNTKIGPSIGTIKQGELIKRKVRDGVIECRSKALIETMVVLIHGLVDEVEVTKEQPRAGNRGSKVTKFSKK